jgi:adenylyltransferase/sulfurtransferase
MDYSRQLILPQLGPSGQQKLQDSRVLVVGAGGLGCAVLPYLAAAGIGTIGIIDGDLIAASNLHRQLLYTEKQIGLSKALEAEKYLNAHFPEAKFRVFNQFLDKANARQILEHFDLVIDATDEISARYLLNDTCEQLGIPWVYGSIHQFQGQVSVFNYREGPNYRDLFPTPDPTAISCSDAGVIGTTVGLIGMLQLNEVLKIQAGFGKVLSGKILIYDLLSCSQQVFEFEKKPRKSTQVEQIVFPLLSIVEAIRPERVLMDVREIGEIPQIATNNYLQVPLSKLSEMAQSLDRDQEIGIFCQSGKRSQQAAELLHSFGFAQIRLIKGGANELLAYLNYEKNIS